MHNPYWAKPAAASDTFSPLTLNPVKKFFESSINPFLYPLTYPEHVCNMVHKIYVTYNQVRAVSAIVILEHAS